MNRQSGINGYSAQGAQQKRSNLGLGIAIGLGIGGAVGGGTAWYFTRKSERKKAAAEVRRARRHFYDEGYGEGYADCAQNVMKKAAEIAENGELSERESELVQNAYDKGVQEATEQAQQWIDENILIVEDNTPEAFKKALSERSERGSDGDVSSAPEVKKTVTETRVEEMMDPAKMKEDGYLVYGSVSLKRCSDDPQAVKIHLYDGSEAVYPLAIFFDERMNPRDGIYVRALLKEHEKNLGILKKVWITCGWGEFYGDIDYSVTQDELDNLEVLADADSGEVDPEEAEAATKNREDFFKDMKEGRDNPNAGAGMIRLITRKEFEEEHYLQPANVDYFDVDNVFIESTDVNSKLDGVEYFGVLNGNDLFDKMKRPVGNEEDGLDNDPDVVYVRNYMKNSVFEVTRYHNAYSGIQDGSAFVNGEPDQRGIEWV